MSLQGFTEEKAIAVAFRVECRTEGSRFLALMTLLSRHFAFIHTAKLPSLGAKANIRFTIRNQGFVEIDGTVITVECIKFQGFGLRLDDISRGKNALIAFLDTEEGDLRAVPQEVQEQRQSMRIPTNLPVSILRGRQEITGTLVDISETGLYLATQGGKWFFAQTVRLQLTIPLDDGNIEPVSLPAQIMRVDPPGKAKRGHSGWGLGLRFTEDNRLATSLVLRLRPALRAQQGSDAKARKGFWKDVQPTAAGRALPSGTGGERPALPGGSRTPALPNPVNTWARPALPTPPPKSSKPATPALPDPSKTWARPALPSGASQQSPPPRDDERQPFPALPSQVGRRTQPNTKGNRPALPASHQKPAGQRPRPATRPGQTPLPALPSRAGGGPRPSNTDWNRPALPASHQKPAGQRPRPATRPGQTPLPALPSRIEEPRKKENGGQLALPASLDD